MLWLINPSKQSTVNGWQMADKNFRTMAITVFEVGVTNDF